MGSPDKRLAAEGLLRERSAGCDGSGFARQVRHLFRYDWWANVRLGGCGRYVVSDRARSSCCSFSRSADTGMIRVELPQHLRTLAKVGREVQLEVPGAVTLRAVLDALEERYPM